MSESTSSSPPSNRTVVVDASVAAAAVLPRHHGGAALALIRQWNQQDRWLIAPAHWLAEAASTVWTYVYDRKLAPQDAESALADLLGLGIESVPADGWLLDAASFLASRFQTRKLYDPLYIALAERQRASLCTQDRQMFKKARDVGVAALLVD